MNIGCLVSLEIIARRIQLIVEALQNPQRPNWEAAKLFAGLPGVEDAVAPALRSYVARRAKGARAAVPQSVA